MTSSNICPHCTQLMRRVPRAPRPERRRRARSHRGATQRFSGVGRPAHSVRRACSARPAAKRRQAGSLFRRDATLLGTRVYPARSQRRLPRRGGAHAQVGPGREARRGLPRPQLRAKSDIGPAGNASRRARAILVQAQRDAGRGALGALRSAR